MASVVSHFLIGATLALPFTAAPSIRKAVRPVGLIFASGLLAAVPDLDAAFFGVIPYTHFFGHRGFFHSPFFAISFALILSCLLYAVSRNLGLRASLWIAAAFALALASHGVLDAMTNAGLGVMLLYPFSEERIFLPWRPFHAPPMKIDSLSLHQVQMMLNSEVVLVLGCAVVAWAIRFALGRLNSRGNQRNAA